MIGTTVAIVLPELWQQMPNRAKFQAALQEQHDQFALECLVSNVPIKLRLDNYGQLLDTFVRVIVRACFICRLCGTSYFKSLPTNEALFECLGCSVTFTDPCRFSERHERTKADREKIDVYYQKLKISLDC